MKQYTLQSSLYYYELKDLSFSTALIAVIWFLVSYAETLLTWIKTETGKVCTLFLVATLVIAVAANMLHLVRSISRKDEAASKTINNF